jgi:membrane-associated phospholipid phosphatase
MVRAWVTAVINPRPMVPAHRPARSAVKLWLVLLVCALMLSTASLSGQSTPRDSSHVSRTFFTRHDAILTVAAVAGTVFLSQYDERIERWARSPDVQGDQRRHDRVDALTHVNETPLTIAAILTYGVGRLGRWKTVTDIGLHVTEAMVLTDVTSELIRGPIGRKRPRVSSDDAFVFQFGKGFTNFENRAFPSLHSAAAFAMASSVTAETWERDPHAARYVGPVLYAAALVPGLTRIYLDQHWASDIASGAFVGSLLGAKVVHYAHSHRQSKLDRVLMGAMILPNGSGGVLVTESLAW